MNLTIQDFYDSRNQLYLPDNTVNKELDLINELGDYLNDIIDEISKELKNISQNKNRNTWRKIKNPKILQKYINFDKNIFSKINLEINKLNHSNYQEIIKSISKSIDEYLNENNDKTIDDIMEHYFFCLIQKYLAEDVENTYYLKAIVEIDDKYKQICIKYFNTFTKHLINYLDEDLHIEKQKELELEKRLIIGIKDKEIIVNIKKIVNIGHIIGFDFNTLYSGKIIDFYYKIYQNNKLIDNLLEWTPINYEHLYFRVSLLVGILESSFQKLYTNLSNDDRRDLELFLDNLSQNTNVNIKIQIISDVLEHINKNQREVK